MDETFRDRFTQRPANQSRLALWQVGDEVLAPWEPTFLYVGTIRQIEGNEAYIAFADGDCGWVYLEDLQAPDIEPGTAVLSRRKMGHLFYPGTVEEAKEGAVLIAFETGEREWCPVAALRLRRAQAGPGAVPAVIASDQMFAKHLQVGDRVLAPWEALFLYAGTVERIQGDEVHVRFDDGDAGWVQLRQVRPLEVPVGLRVFGRWKMGAAYYPGTVVAVRDESVRIVYDDGDQEWTKLAGLRVLGVPAGPNARPTHIRFRASSLWGLLVWLVPIGIALLMVLRPGGCR